MHSHKNTIILLVNDEAVTRQIAKVLGSTYVLTRVRNLRSATGMIETDAHIAAIITEQGAATGDAIEALDTIRGLRPQIRRIMLTSYADLSGIVHGLHSGAVQALVQKPISDEELLAALCPEMLHAPTANRRASA